MINEILSTGKDNATTGRDICLLLGITLRDLTAAVEKERRDGFPICASTGDNPGYYLAGNQKEMQNYCRSLEHRRQELTKTLQACLASMQALPE